MVVLIYNLPHNHFKLNCSLGSFLAKYYNLFICVHPVQHNISYRQAVQPLVLPNNKVDSSVRPLYIPNTLPEQVFRWPWYILLGLIQHPLSSPDLNLSQLSSVIQSLTLLTFHSCIQMHYTGTGWCHSCSSGSFCWQGTWDTLLTLLASQTVLA